MDFTESAITVMFNGGISSDDFKPVLQVLEVILKPELMYMLVLSDGSHYHLFVLSAQYNELVKVGNIQKGSIVKITNFAHKPNPYDIVVIAITELDVICLECDLIGTPVQAQPMLPDFSLTKSGVMALHNLLEFTPVLQVLKIKRDWSSNNGESYKIDLSDGSFYREALVAGKSLELVQFGSIRRGSVIKLTHFTFHDEVVVIYELDVLFMRGDIIGKPVPAPYSGVSAGSL